jgi:hypothetical protein
MEIERIDIYALYFDKCPNWFLVIILCN